MRFDHGGARDPRLLDFSVCVNPLGPPQGVRDVLADAQALARRYPSPDAEPLRVRIAAHHGIHTECVLVGNGAAELLYLVARLHAGAGASIPRPAFSEYEAACAAAGVPVVSEVAGNADVTFLANPSSPGGRLAARRELRRLPGHLVVDEAYIELEGERESLVDLAAGDPRFTVVRSLTKFYGIPGLRLGYAVADPERIRRLRELQPPWSVNALAEACGAAALEDAAFAERTRRVLPALREKLALGLVAVGLRPEPSAAGFLLCRVPDARRLCAALLTRGLAARDCSSFRGLEANRFVRFGVRSEEENAHLVRTLGELQS